MSSDNKLKINTDSLDLELDGDRDYIERAYLSMRRVLTEQFLETMRANPQDGRDTVELDAQSREPLDQGPLPGEPGEDERFINVVVSEDIYNKLYMLEEERLQKSILGRFLSLNGIKRIYLDENVERLFRQGIDLGDTLWRELTNAGKAAIGRGD
ncbi:MAG: hypothetical protein ACQEVA_05870 [Myxococcota bacterium]